jgi:glycosyltransferase involved in cell wall biosynthesis
MAQANRSVVSSHVSSQVSSQVSSSRPMAETLPFLRRNPYARSRRNLNPTADLLVFSHLRWNFIFQRPQHLLTRFAKERRVFYVEEPEFVQKNPSPSLKTQKISESLTIVTPQLAQGVSEEVAHAQQRSLLDRFLLEQSIDEFVSWYYTPMFLPYTDHLDPLCVIYDCMDELSLFKNAHPKLCYLESKLLSMTDLMFTGGYSLYEYKCNVHHNIHPVPSSIDHAHFAQARRIKIDPVDQKDIPHLRIGFAGVIDERLDIALLEGIARIRRNWHWILLGPIVKIDPESLPRLPNIHYLGSKQYSDLPQYLSGWDVAMLPFARNAATRFISPTKTPEYLAAGKPVVSTSINDVVRPYGIQNLVKIADDALSFVAAIEKALKSCDREWLKRVDTFLAKNSWDDTWTRMNGLLEKTIDLQKQQVSEPRSSS